MGWRCLRDGGIAGVDRRSLAVTGETGRLANAMGEKKRTDGRVWRNGDKYRCHESVQPSITN